MDFSKTVITPFGLFEFPKITFGQRKAAQSFQRFRHQIRLHFSYYTMYTMYMLLLLDQKIYIKHSTFKLEYFYSDKYVLRDRRVTTQKC